MKKNKKRMIYTILGILILIAMIMLALSFGTKRMEAAKRNPIRMGVKSVDPVEDSSDFVMLADVDPNIIQEMRYDTAYNFMGKQMEGFEASIAILTKETADALYKANQTFMANGYCLKIYQAYCPKQTMDEIYRWSKDEEQITNKNYFYPNLKSKEDFFREGYLKIKSEYTRGSTVAVTLVDLENGKEVDMGSSFDYYDPISFTNATQITKKQKENRDYLEMIMKRCNMEHSGVVWWQFTLQEEPYPDTYFEFPVDILTKEVYF